MSYSNPSKLFKNLASRLDDAQRRTPIKGGFVRRTRYVLWVTGQERAAIIRFARSR